jgi:hypothetical protein
VNALRLTHTIARLSWAAVILAMIAGCQTNKRTAPATDPLHGSYFVHAVGDPTSGILEGMAYVASGTLYLAFSADADETHRLLRETQLQGGDAISSDNSTACWGQGEDALDSSMQIFSGQLYCFGGIEFSFIVLKGPFTVGIGVVRADCTTLYDFVVGGLAEDALALALGREPDEECEEAEQSVTYGSSAATISKPFKLSSHLLQSALPAFGLAEATGKIVSGEMELVYGVFYLSLSQDTIERSRLLALIQEKKDIEIDWDANGDRQDCWAIARKKETGSQQWYEGTFACSDGLRADLFVMPTSNDDAFGYATAQCELLYTLQIGGGLDTVEEHAVWIRELGAEDNCERSGEDGVYGN